MKMPRSIPDFCGENCNIPGYKGAISWTIYECENRFSVNICSEDTCCALWYGIANKREGAAICRLLNGAQGCAYLSLDGAPRKRYTAVQLLASLKEVPAWDDLYYRDGSGIVHER